MLVLRHDLDGNLLAYPILNHEIKTYGIKTRPDKWEVCNWETHGKQVKRQALCALGPSPQQEDRIVAVLSVGRSWKWAVLRPDSIPALEVETSPFMWVNQNLDDMEFVTPWSEAFSLDDDWTVEHRDAFVMLIDAIVGVATDRLPHE